MRNEFPENTEEQNRIPREMVALAEAIARKVHNGQFRRCGLPYIVHPEDVVRRLRETYPEDFSVHSVGWLHDVLEDSDMHPQDLIREGITWDATYAVSVMTKHKGERYEEYLIRVKENDLARRVKIADIRSNLSDAPKPETAVKYEKALKFLEG